MYARIIELQCEKTSLRVCRLGETQMGLCSHRKGLKARNFGFRKKRNFTIRVAKTKALNNFVVTAKLVCTLLAHLSRRLTGELIG